jgi:tetratricopeptide (TPR) repeat protein
MTETFASEGFDLDAAANADGVLEIGGGAAIRDPAATGGADLNDGEEEAAGDTAGAAPPGTVVETEDPMETAESYKQRGNDHFSNKEWKEAFEWYTRAIKATPGLSGEEVMAMKKVFDDAETKRWREAMKEYDRDREKGTEPEKRPEFVPPTLEYGEKLAVYHCNRAASSLQISQYHQEERNTKDAAATDDSFGEKKPPPHHLGWAIRDCSIAILLNPRYTKAYIRRATAYERCLDTEQALRDAELAYGHDRSNRAVREQMERLKKMEEERLEKLKTETLGKLKDLGNSLLSNFGLSLDNFNAVKDPNTGSYSINFQNK